MVLWYRRFNSVFQNCFDFYGPLDYFGGFPIGRNIVRGLGVIFAVRRSSRFFFVRFVLHKCGFRISPRCRIRTRIHLCAHGRIANNGLANDRDLAENAVWKTNDA